MLELECPKCEAALNLDSAFAGGICRCPRCGKLMNVPIVEASESSADRGRPERPEHPEVVVQPAGIGRERTRDPNAAPVATEAPASVASHSGPSSKADKPIPSSSEAARDARAEPDRSMVLGWRNPLVLAVLIVVGVIAIVGVATLVIVLLR